MNHPQHSPNLRDKDLINKYLSPIVKTMGNRFGGNESEALQQRTKDLRLEFAQQYAARLVEVPADQRYEFAIAFEQEMRSTWNSVVAYENQDHRQSFENGYRRLLAVMTIPAAAPTEPKPAPVADPHVRRELASVLTGPTTTQTHTPERRPDTLTLHEREAINVLVGDFVSRVATAVSGPYGPSAKAGAADVARENGKKILELFLQRPIEERAQIMPIMQAEVLRIALPRMTEYAQNSDFSEAQCSILDSYLPRLLRAMHLGS